MFALVQLQLKKYFKQVPVLVMPLVLLGLFVASTWLYADYQTYAKKSQQITIGVVQEDLHPLAKVLIDSFTNNQDFTALFDIRLGSKAVIQADFKRGDLDAYILIPQGYIDGLMHYENHPITLYAHGENTTKNKVLDAVLSAYAAYIEASDLATLSLYQTIKASGAPPDLVTKSNDQFSIEMIGATMGRQALFKDDPLVQIPYISVDKYMLGALSFTFISFFSLAFGQEAQKSRKSLTLKRLMTLGFTPLRVLVAQSFSNLLIMLYMLSPLVIGLVSLLGPSQAPKILGLIIVASLLWSGLCRVLSFAFKSQQAYALSSALVAFFASLVGGGLIPYVILPTLIKHISPLSPTYSLTRALWIKGLAPITLAIMTLCVLGLLGLETYLLKKHLQEACQ